MYKHIRFSTEVEEARWDEQSNTWKTKVNRLGSKDAEFGKDYTITSDFLVSGVGQLNIPRYPDIDGLESFEGKTIHSARWDWDYDLRDKKIGIIGNGATSAQIIPEIAKVCKNLTVFQRTPNWAVPRLDNPISPTMRAVFKYAPFIRRRYRAALMDFRESFFDCVFTTESDVHQMLRDMANEHIATQLPGEKYAKLREQLQPHYAIGCKRVMMTDDYFPTFTRNNVFLETTKIDSITPNGVAVEGGKNHEFDLLVLATGFKTTQFMYPIKIYGAGGKSIEDIWSNGASAYLGMTVPEMPNFAMLYGKSYSFSFLAWLTAIGPNTNLGHNSIILMIEAQALYINALIQKVKAAKDSGTSISIRPKARVAQQYNQEIQARLSQSAFADPNCNSWYKNESGLITNNWSDAVIPYQKRTSTINWHEFDIGGLGAAAVMREGKVQWKRVVEETQVSNTVILTGLVTTGVAVAAGILYRGTLHNLKKRAF